MALLCTQCGREIIGAAPFCASCGTPAPAFAPSTASAGMTAAAAAGPRMAPAPKTGGCRGLFIALTSLGCVGAIVVGVIALAVVLYTMGRSSPDGGAGSSQQEGPVYTETLDKLMPQDLGGYTLQKIQSVDAETMTMFGAADALQARYSSSMSLLVLNYSSSDRAGRAVGALRSALLPDSEGWKVVEEGAVAPAHRVAVLQQSTGKLATIWNYGSLILIFWGDAAQVPDFEKSAPEILQQR